MRSLLQPNQSLHDELSLIQKCKDDPTTFQYFYKRYYTEILNYVLHKTNCVYISEDIASVVFYKAYRKIVFFENRGISIRSWLYKIAHNEFIQYKRIQSKTVNCPIEFDYQFVDQETGLEFNEQRYNELSCCLNQLPDLHHEIIRLRYFNKLSFKEIGETLGITENSAKVMCNRIIQKLRKNRTKFFTTDSLFF